MNTQTETPTRLHGRWLLLARLAWAVVFLTLTAIYAFGFLAVHETLSTICDPEPCSLREQIRGTEAGERIMRSAGPPVGYADRLRPEQVEALETLGFTLDQYGWLGALQLGIPALVLLLIAAGLFWWKSDDWMALFASIMVATFPIHNMPLAFTLTVHQPAWDWVGNSVTIVALSCLLIFPLIFPTGQFVPRWTRWMAIYDVGAAVIVSFLPILEVFGDALGRPMIGVLVLLPFGIGIYAQLYRFFRVARPAERQQFKWVVVGLAGTLVIQFAVLIPLNALLTSPAVNTDPARALVLSAIPDTLWQLNNLLIAVCIVISVLRYRLWDVDILINRSLVYSTLVAVITGLYVLVVGSLSSLLQNQNDLTAPLAALLIVAALVRPLLRALQNNVNRLLRFDPSRRDESESLQRSLEQPDKAQEEHIQIQGITEVDSSPHTRLHGRWLLIARLAWAAVFLTLTVMYALGFLAVRDVLVRVCEEEPCTLGQQIRRTEAGEQVMDWGGPPIGFADPLRPDQVEALAKLGLTLHQYGWLGSLQMGIPALWYLLIAAGLFWRKSDDWMVLFISTVVMTSALVDMPLPYTLVVRQPVWEWVHTPANFLAVSSWFTWPLIFPTGRFVPRWMSWKILFDIAFAAIGWLMGSILRERAGWWDFVYIYVLLSICTNVYALSYRYFRVATPVERQQIKWVFVGLMGFIMIAFVSLQFEFQLISRAGSMDLARALILSVIPDTLYRAVALFIPVSIAISVLRYRLWDIDIMISRTLVYSTLTAVIAGLYILVVGSLIRVMQYQNDLAAAAVALLIVAALFQPLRRSLQNIVNRLLRFDPGRRDESQFALQKSSEQPEEAREENVPIHVIPESDSSPHTRLHGRWLVLARLAWVAIAILAMVVYVAAAPVAFHVLATPCHSEPCMSPFQPGPDAEVTPQKLASLKVGAWYHTMLEAVIRLLTLGVALFIFWRRSNDWMAHVASTMLVTFFAIFSPSPMMLAQAQPLWSGPLILLRFIALASTVGLFYLFPDGRFVPRWTRRLAIALLVLIGAFAAAGAPFQMGLPVFLIILITGAGFQIYRYRKVSSSIQRQQTKWVVLGIAGMVLPLLVFFLFAFLNPDLNPLRSNAPILSQGALIFTLMVMLCVVIPLCFLPVTLAFSILRYRLWDVDLVINRTLVYGALTSIVVALYVWIVGWSSIGLQTQNELAGSVLAVLVIAFLFRPLRQRLQRIADRFMPVPQTAAPAEQHKHPIAISQRQGAADTRLHGRWLFIARLAWVIMFLTLTTMYAFGFVAGREVLSTVCEAEPCTLEHQVRHTEAGAQILDYIGPPVGYADPLRPNQVEALQRLGLTLNRYGWLAALQMGIPILVYLLIAAGLFWRKSDDWMVLFVSIMLATFPLQGMGVPLPFTLVVSQPAWEWVYFPGMAAAIIFVVIFPLIFPTGQFVPRWTRWIAVFEVAGAVLVTWFQYSIMNVPAGELVLVYLYISFGAGIYAQLYRYFRVATPIERQQIKWVIVGMAAYISTAVLLLVPLNGLLASRAASMDPAQAFVLSTIPDILYRIISFFVPVAILISVLRYRLWDIDIIINRTLVYGALTGIVVSAFVILVGFLSILFQSSGNSIIAIIATGLVALLFNPLRQRLQRSVNHLMYGERDEPYTALSRLGRQLEVSLAPEAVLPTVVTTVRDVLRLPYVAIYLQQDTHGYKIVAESASPLLRIENGRIRVPGMEREGRCIPLIHQGETVGYIVLGPRAPNEAFSTTDLHLLQDLAPQVGVAVHAVRLTADLQRSRERLVLAREEERRRLRRDLHDGLGPQLAGLALKLETLRNRLHGDPLADSILADLAKRTQDATADVRHLVYELRPPTLDEFGLVMALREGVAQFTQQGVNGVRITFEAPQSLPPLPAAVEVAVYRIVQEALTNVVRHAGASTCLVRLSLDTSAGLLCLEVQDDGKGLSITRRAGIGLNSMRERAEELGGTFTITSIPTGGIHLTAQLPCRVGDRNILEASQEEGRTWTPKKSAS